MVEQTNKEQMLEDIMKEFSAQGELVNGLGDALMHIARAGHFDEQGQWQEPEWKKTVLFDVAQARALIQKLYETVRFNKANIGPADWPYVEGMTTPQDA